eukprot:s367_g17.t1
MSFSLDICRFQQLGLLDLDDFNLCSQLQILESHFSVDLSINLYFVKSTGSKFQVGWGRDFPTQVGRSGLWMHEPGGVSWPGVEPGVLSHLQKLFHSPLQLDAAFDNEDECEELIVEGFPAMLDELRRDTVAQMMEWKASSVRALKRCRRSIATSSLFRLPQPADIPIHEEFTRLTRTSIRCILEMHTKRRQRKYKEDPPDARAKRFESERKKYSLLLAQVMVEAGLPVVALVQTLDDPAAGWVHLFAARRGNTLKNRFKVWKPFQKWLETHRGYLFPKGVKDAVDYMQHRVNEGCGRTVPEALSATLSLIEQVGRVVEGERISDDPLWRGHVKSWTAELSVESPPKKPAEMYTVAIVLALELTVVDEKALIFQRALAWVTLCMVWGAMRCDDMQAVIPYRSVMSNYGLRLVLGRSKTTGPDKVQKEVSVHIFRTVSLSGEDWLRAGFDIWESDQFKFRRDFMVMEPAPDWQKVRRKFLPPSGLASEISKLLSVLCVPRKVAFGWELMPHCLLLPDGLESFYSGHSPRNFLTSVAAAIGFSRDERAFLGRWSMGMVSSEEYVRTSRQVVFRIQKAVNRSLVEGRTESYFEDEAIQRLCDAAEASGANPNRIKKRHTTLSNWAGRHSLGGVYPTLEIFEDDWQEDADAEDTAVAVLEAAVALNSKASESQPQSHTYFITISRRTCMRRLHLAGCFVKPDRCCEVVFTNEISSEDFDTICQACKKKMMSECGNDDAENSASSTASSSSTASEASEGNEPID